MFVGCRCGRSGCRALRSFCSGFGLVSVVVVFPSALTRAGVRPLGGTGRCRRLGLLRQCWVLRPGPLPGPASGEQEAPGRQELLEGLPSFLPGRRSPLCSHLVRKQRATVARSKLTPAPGRGPSRWDFAGGLQSDPGSKAPWAGGTRLPAARAFSPGAQGRWGTAGPLDFSSLALLLVCARRVTSVVPDSVILGYCPSFDLILSN